MSGFTKVPNALVADATLSFGARAVYPALLHHAWKAGRRSEEDGTDLPALDEIARLVGCSRTALKGYINELRGRGWVATRRRARQQPQIYWILDAADPDFVGRIPAYEPGVRGADSALRNGGSVPIKAKTSEAIASDSREPGQDRPIPDHVRVDGRDVALDALLQECSIDEGSPRIGQAAAALHGRAGGVGIRELFWREACRYADQHPEAEGRLEALHGEPEEFATALSRAIGRKAALYRERVPGMLTPTALRNWWLDLERQRDLAAAGRGDSLTADEIRNLA